MSRSLKEVSIVIRDNNSGPILASAAKDALSLANSYRNFAIQYRRLAIDLRMQLAKNSRDGAIAWVDGQVLK